ncbi:unnamed protein product [Urochloa humidicola]
MEELLLLLPEKGSDKKVKLLLPEKGPDKKVMLLLLLLLPEKVKLLLPEKGPDKKVMLLLPEKEVSFHLVAHHAVCNNSCSIFRCARCLFIVDSNGKKRRYYSDDLKIAIYLELLAKTDPPVLHHGVSKEVAEKFGVPRLVVQRIWRSGQDHGGIVGVKNKLVRNCGRKRIEIDMEAIKDVPLRERTTFQDLANALGVKKISLYNRYKQGYFRRHTNDLKFLLTDENKKARVRYCLSMFQALYLDNDPSFNPMYTIVYIDEKWFYRTRRNQKYYLTNDEERPHREVKSKNFIEKVMFLAVVTRPRFDANGNCTFDGKLGIFPFTYVEPAKRKSPNRPRGTLITKAMTSVKKEHSRDFLINKYGQS